MDIDYKIGPDDYKIGNIIYIHIIYITYAYAYEYNISYIWIVEIWT